MGQVVNLRTIRKRARRQHAAEEAGANRLKHGRTQSARSIAAAQSDKDRRDLDSHRLTGGDES